MKFSELYKILEKDGWKLERTKKHHIFSHPVKKGRLPVGKHSSQEVATGTLNSILKLAGLK
jgi:predicted RNA binding protein YcfA (HicA-like mRNA interferase family)